MSEIITINPDDYNGVECRCGNTRWIHRDLSEWTCDRCGRTGDRDKDGRWWARPERPEQATP